MLWWLLQRLLALYVCSRLAKLLYSFFREYFVLWHVAMGAMPDRRRAVSTKTRLHLYMCETHLLDEVAVNELFTFMGKMAETDYSIKQFHSILLSYGLAVLCRERTDGSLRGVALLSVEKKETKTGYKYTIIRLGASFYHIFYRGGPYFYYATMYLILKELILHPLTPLYVVSKPFSHKSYVTMCNALPRLHPRHDREMPDLTRTIIDDYAITNKSPNEEYDSERFVLKREKSTLKQGVVTISEVDLKDPHIKFFAEQNPGWDKGHMLIVAGEVGWRDLFRMLWIALSKVKRARGGGAKPRGRKKKLLKRYSFQNETAMKYATLCSVSDVPTINKDNHSNESSQDEGEERREVSAVGNHVTQKEEEDGNGQEGKDNSLVMPPAAAAEKGDEDEVFEENTDKVSAMTPMKKVHQKPERTISRLYSYDIFPDLQAQLF